MLLIRDFDHLPPTVRGGALAVGNFDGVHRGHAELVARLRRRAAEVGGPAVVFTFDPHPVQLLRPAQAPPPLTWTDRKAELLGELGVDAMIAYPTDEALLALSPHEFFERIVRQALAARAMVEGPNFYFGRRREGDIPLLRQLTADAGLTLEVVEPIQDAGGVVSSSRIRQAIAAGDVDSAREMLNRPYRIRGLVTHGARRGGKLGFPTANLSAVDTLLPGDGVYAGRAYAASGVYPAAIHIGVNPTFVDPAGALKVEAHLLDASLELYGEPLEVDFWTRLRDNRTFGSVEQLQQQLTADVARVRALTP